MRLICPNCGAQYEVPDGVIPKTGRDLECSGCDHSWFQNHPDQDREFSEDPDEQVFDEERTALEDVAPEGTHSPAEEPEHGSGFSPPPDPPQMPRRDLPDAVSSVLREEAQAEVYAREAERSVLESQPDLGFADGGESDSARLRSENTDAPINDPHPVPRSRSDLLPNIDEIKSTLESGGDRSAPAAAVPVPPRRRARGFRRGFILAVSLAVLALGTYLFAPAIVKQLPQVEPYLDRYVREVDGARVWLDAEVNQLLEWLDSKASSAAGNGPASTEEAGE